MFLFKHGSVCGCVRVGPGALGVRGQRYQIPQLCLQLPHQGIFKPPKTQVSPCDRLKCRHRLCPLSLNSPRQEARAQQQTVSNSSLYRDGKISRVWGSSLVKFTECSLQERRSQRPAGHSAGKGSCCQTRV